MEAILNEEVGLLPCKGLSTKIVLWENRPYMHAISDRLAGFGVQRLLSCLYTYLKPISIC